MQRGSKTYKEELINELEKIARMVEDIMPQEQNKTQEKTEQNSENTNISNTFTEELKNILERINRLSTDYMEEVDFVLKKPFLPKSNFTVNLKQKDESGQNISTAHTIKVKKVRDNSQIWYIKLHDSDYRTDIIEGLKKDLNHNWTLINEERMVDGFSVGDPQMIRTIYIQIDKDTLMPWMLCRPR